VEQYSAAELTEIALSATSMADVQFQYWLTVTFAAVVAAFVAGQRLNLLLRSIAAVLYLLTAILLVSRFYSAVTIFGFMWSALADRGIEIPSNPVAWLFRGSVFVLGTGAAILFLLLPKIAKANIHGGSD